MIWVKEIKMDGWYMLSGYGTWADLEAKTPEDAPEADEASEEELEELEDAEDEDK